MTAEELVAALHGRMETRRRRKERRTTAWLTAGCLGLALCLGTMVFGGAAHPGGTAGVYSGATMLFENAGGYVMTAVLAFMAGVIITVVLMRRRAKQKDMHGTEDMTE